MCFYYSCCAVQCINVTVCRGRCCSLDEGRRTRIYSRLIKLNPNVTKLSPGQCVSIVFVCVCVHFMCRPSIIFISFYDIWLCPVEKSVCVPLFISHFFPFGFVAFFSLFQLKSLTFSHSIRLVISTICAQWNWKSTRLLFVHTLVLGRATKRNTFTVTLTLRCAHGMPLKIKMKIRLHLISVPSVYFL